MAEDVSLPEGFVLDEPQSNLPEGFTVDTQQPAQQQSSLGANLLGMGLGGAGAIGVGYGVSKGWKSSANLRNKKYYNF